MLKFNPCHSLLHIDKTPPIAPLPTKPQAAPTFFVDELQDLARLRGSLPSIPRLARLPRRRRHTVLLIPGWKMPEETLYALRTYLRAIGYDAHGWGLGTNRGQPEKDRDRLIPKLQEAYSRHGSKVTLIGWSLGGVIAREVARLHPTKSNASLPWRHPSSAVLPLPSVPTHGARPNVSESPEASQSSTSHHRSMYRSLRFTPSVTGLFRGRHASTAQVGMYATCASVQRISASASTLMCGD